MKMLVKPVDQYNTLKPVKMVFVYARTANPIRMLLLANAKIVKLERSVTKLIQPLALLAPAMRYQQMTAVLFAEIANLLLKMR